MANASSVVALVLALIFGIGLSIACIVIAVMFEGECPIQKYTTIYLYVVGGMSIGKAILVIIQVICSSCGCDDCRLPLMIIDIIIGVFLFAWLIAGSVWVFKYHKKYDPDDPESPLYCNPTLYKFAFWFLVCQWIIGPVTTIVSVCAGNSSD